MLGIGQLLQQVCGAAIDKCSELIPNVGTAAGGLGSAGIQFVQDIIAAGKTLISG